MNDRYLKQGDTIGIVSPSSPINPGSLEAGIHYLNQKGFKVKVGRHIKDIERFLAGKDEDRAQDIMDFFRDPKVKAIIASRGGQGSQRLLPLLDYSVIRENPKLVVGFSDTTALQLGLLKMAELRSYTGYTLTIEPDLTMDRTLIQCLTGEPYCMVGGVTVVPGIARGALIGGNLTLLTSLLGTPYLPDFKESILLIEDVGIEPYKVDGMLSHLSLAGVFDQVAGVIFGQFEKCIFSEFNEGIDRLQGTVDEIINDWSSRLCVPCLKDFPYGHGKQSCVLPIGGTVLLNANEETLDIFP